LIPGGRCRRINRRGYREEKKKINRPSTGSGQAEDAEDAEDAEGTQRRKEI